MFSAQTNRLPTSKKNGKMNPDCSNCKNIPSQDNCCQCLLNLTKLLNSDYYEDENLSDREQITRIKLDLDKLKPVLSLFIQIFDAYSDKLILHEKKLIELLTKDELMVSDSSINVEMKPITTRKRIPIIGKISDVGQKIGKFFFNPDFKDGLHLPKIHEAAIIELFSMFCESVKGTEYGSSYFFDNVITGANKVLDKKPHE